MTYNTVKVSRGQCLKNITIKLSLQETTMVFVLRTFEIC